MRRALLILAIVFQVAVLAFMAGKRELVSATGTVIHLRTAPIDPRDLFRGDYVRLRYEASVIPLANASPDIAAMVKKYTFGSTVYAPLSIGDGGLAVVTGITTTRPGSGLYLKGRLAQPWQLGIVLQDMVGVEYGIEAYYVQQGKGLEIEKEQGGRNRMQKPLEMEVAVGGDGTAVIRGFRWSPIGIGLEALESPRQNDAAGRKSAKFRLMLKNTSEKPLALVNLPGFCSLVLEPVSAGQKAKPQERPACNNLIAAESDVLVLQPGNAGYYDIDLADPQWYVLSNNVPVEAGPLDWHERFRLVYAPPAAEGSSHLKDAAQVWHGRLPSQAFHGRGNID